MSAEGGGGGGRGGKGERWSWSSVGFLVEDVNKERVSVYFPPTILRFSVYLAE